MDGTVGFTGGAGIADWFNPDAAPEQYWEDCMVEMSGPVVADWHALFARTWRRCRQEPLDIEIGKARLRNFGQHLKRHFILEVVALAE